MLLLAFASFSTVFKSFGGIAEAWEQVEVQVQLFVIQYQHVVGLCFKELMAMDTVALLVQKLGVVGLENVHMYAYYGAPLANDRNRQAMDLMVNQLVPRNLIVQHCELEWDHAIIYVSALYL